ncbi:hypothetical protein [Streptomyces parvulus]
MNAVLVDIAPTRTIAGDDPNAIVLLDDVAALTADAVPGCGDDNPYN